VKDHENVPLAKVEFQNLQGFLKEPTNNGTLVAGIIINTQELGV
jgi:hypothetical protein